MAQVESLRSFGTVNGATQLSEEPDAIQAGQGDQMAYVKAQKA